MFLVLQMMDLERIQKDFKRFAILTLLFTFVIRVP